MLRRTRTERRVPTTNLARRPDPPRVPSRLEAMDTTLLPELLDASARRAPAATALTSGPVALSYETLSNEVARFAAGLVAIGIARSERVGIYLDKRPETVIAAFGSAAAGAVFVPLNPLLKP